MKAALYITAFALVGGGLFAWFAVRKEERSYMLKVRYYVSGGSFAVAGVLIKIANWIDS